jgi:NAD(P)H-hydrate repair Nnr-like enzyme with NAD(P)H-hydrate dehydratase domain
MALPIGDTPILGRKEAVKFLKKVEEDLKKSTRLILTPKIEEARRLVKEYAAKSEK